MGRVVGAALSVVVAQPSLWLLGCAGFLLRGGIVLLALPIWTLPSPVGVATLLGPGVVDTGRLEGPLLAVVAAGIAILVGLGAGGLLGAAWIEAVLFERYAADPETAELRAWRAMSATAPRPLAALVAVQLLSLAPAVGAAAVSLDRIVQVVRQEILLPGDLAVPLALRAAAGASGPLALLVGSLVLAEALNGVLSRRVLLRGLPAARHPRSPARRFLGVVATAAAGWLLAAVVLVAAMTGALIAWDGTRAAYLTGVPIDLRHLGGVMVSAGATVVFVGAWVGTLLLGGVVSTLRSALWTGRAIAAQRDWTGGGD